MQNNHFCFLAIIFFTSIFSLQAQKPGFYVQGRFLYDKCGEKTVLRGVNEMSVWAGADPTGAMYMPEIRKTGANCVRIAWHTGGAITILDQVIQNCINNKMIPMIEMHDATGDFSKMPSIVAFWTRADVVNLIKKHEQYLLVNIANEAGDGSESDATFTQTYINAIQSMRTAGIRTPLVVDANEWGKKLTTLNNTATAILNGDPDKNVLFSAHLYWPKYNGATSNFITTELQKAVNAGYCLIVGEVSKYGAWAGNGVSVCSQQGEIDYPTILQECQKHNIGWLAWSWGTASNTGGGDPVCVNMDMATGGKFNNLQAGWATEVALSSVNSIKNTSVTPKFILNGSCSTTPISNDKLLFNEILSILKTKMPGQANAFNANYNNGKGKGTLSGCQFSANELKILIIGQPTNPMLLLRIDSRIFEENGKIYITYGFIGKTPVTLSKSGTNYGLTWQTKSGATNVTHKIVLSPFKTACR